MYQTKLRALLSPSERQIFSKLNSPKKIQVFLDRFPTEYFSEMGEPIIKSPLHSLRVKKLHCMEGAMIAATALAYHGHKPLLMDIQSQSFDYDHVVVLYKVGKYWGAISKTNHPVLRWRDPVYVSVRELAMSYFNEYFWPEKDRHMGEKTMVAYSAPFDLSRYKPEQWLDVKDLDWLAEDLDASTHYPVVPKNFKKYLHRAKPVEIQAMKLEEWKKKRK